MTDVNTIAQVCHEANRAWCEANGDTSQKAWTLADQWQRDSAIAGVRFAVEHPTATPADQHQSWMNDKIKDGWVFGAVKDAAAKTHPCLVPYADLPATQRAKDALFLGVVRALTSLQTPMPPVAQVDPASETLSVWMSLMGLEIDRRPLARQHYRSVDWGYWKGAFERGVTPAEALDEDMQKRAAAGAPPRG